MGKEQWEDNGFGNGLINIWNGIKLFEQGYKAALSNRRTISKDMINRAGMNIIAARMELTSFEPKQSKVVEYLKAALALLKGSTDAEELEK